MIVTFFLPFFAVSCGEIEFSLSGFEMFAGKTEGNFQQDGSPFALILIIPPVILFALTFLMRKIKEETKQILLIKNIFIIMPVFNIFAAVTLRFAAKIMLEKRIADYLGELNTESFSVLKQAVNLHIRYGFILYIVFNILILLLSSVNSFLNVKKE